MAKQKTTISLDFDGTITSDPETYKQLAKTLKAAGHTVYIVTMRYPSEVISKQSNGLSIQEEWSNLVDGIYTTSRMAKRDYMLSHGIKIDVWIDDRPEAVYMDASEAFAGPATPEGLTVIETPSGPKMALHEKLLEPNKESVDLLVAYAKDQGISLLDLGMMLYDPMLLRVFSCDIRVFSRTVKDALGRN